MKKSESDTKQNVRLFESKKDNNTSTNYKPKEFTDALEGRYVECKSEKNKKHQWKNTVKILGSTYVCDR